MRVISVKYVPGEAKVNNNLSLWGNVGVQLGDKGYSDTQGMLGVKYSW